jgi:ubiquinone/menaquinone biosynthesis C-methylase UbiE/DNA-binding transcriptional ArsR family regulator
MLISPILRGKRISADRLVAALRAAGEPTRLRILALLAQGELAVGELAQALGQSQPRVSRHLRLLTEAGLIERTAEGAWAFYRLARMPGAERALAELFGSLCDPEDAEFARDARRLADIRNAREAQASAYFEANAADWDRIRKLHLPEADIEAAVLRAAGEGPFDLMIDAGVGAGRMIEVFAERVKRAEGFDTSRKMLALARAALDGEPKAAVQLGDIYDPPHPPSSADLVTIHHVLHFLADPARALKEAARLLKPGGRLVIVDFAPHDLEFLRERHAHRRLGFSDAEIARWSAEAGVRNLHTETLAPAEPGADKLTVKIWAGDRAGLAAAPDRTEKAA